MVQDAETHPPAGDAGERVTDMATLLEESLDYRSPQRGEIVEGTVMGWDRDGALIDIGAKSEGLVPRHEMQSLAGEAEARLQAGENVLVFVVQPDSSDGQIILSVDKARGEHGWHTLQERFDSGETFEGTVTGFNKGGLLVNVEGVNAFVPLSQVVGVRPDRGREDGGSNLAETVGKPLRLKVIEINRRRNRVILSERAALQEWRVAQKERLIQELHEGDIRRGRISSVRSFGVFVDLGGADGLAHLSELSWDRDKTPQELFNVGDEVDVYITKIDPENKKIALSLRRANPEQWDAVVDKYKEGSVVSGVVTKLVPFGAFARIEGPVEGLIHVSELVDRRITHPKEVAQEGDILPLKIVRIERDRHRLGLSLRRARDEGESMGYVFSEGGEVLSVPEDIRADIEEREGPLPKPPQDDESVDAPYASVSSDDGAPSVTVQAPDGVAGPEASVDASMEDEDTAAIAPVESPAAEEAESEAPAVTQDIEETPAPVAEADATVSDEPAADAPAAVDDFSETPAQPADVGETLSEEPAVEANAAGPEPAADADAGPSMVATNGQEEEQPALS